MLQELKEAILKVEQLKEEEQRQIAKLLQEEMSWEASFEITQPQLSKLADEALEDYKAGKTIQTDW